MESSLYDYGRQQFLEGNISYLTDDIKAILVDNSYTPDLVNHRFYDEVMGVISSATSLTNKGTLSGVASADPITFNAVFGNIYYVLIYKDTGMAATSPLLCLFSDVPGFPINSAGDNISLNWGSGSNELFRL